MLLYNYGALQGSDAILQIACAKLGTDSVLYGTSALLTKCVVFSGPLL